jgi:hypothetical protein
MATLIVHKTKVMGRRAGSERGDSYGAKQEVKGRQL